ncbi:MAG: hypothetical protein ACOCXM_06760 [Myxococcota bacterium]
MNIVRDRILWIAIACASLLPLALAGGCEEQGGDQPEAETPEVPAPLEESEPGAQPEPQGADPMGGGGGGPEGAGEPGGDPLGGGEEPAEDPMAEPGDDPLGGEDEGEPGAEDPAAP